jgi:hypothetical protein
MIPHWICTPDGFGLEAPRMLVASAMDLADAKHFWRIIRVLKPLGAYNRHFDLMQCHAGKRTLEWHLLADLSGATSHLSTNT